MPEPFVKVEPKIAQPPRGTTTRTPKVSSGTIDLIPLDKLSAAIEMQYDSLAAFLLAFYPATAMQITDDSHKIAETYVEVARRTPSFHKALSKMLNSAGMATIIAAHANIAFAIYAEQQVPRGERMERALNIGANKLPDEPPTNLSGVA